jgi:hypothetical protein
MYEVDFGTLDVRIMMVVGRGDLWLNVAPNQRPAIPHIPTFIAV